MQVGPLDEETLETVAKDGQMDYDKWPAILEPLLERLDQIVHNDFPVPVIPPSAFIPPTLAPTDILPQIGSESPSQLPNTRTQQENGSAHTTPQRPLPPVPPFDSSATSISRVPESLPPSQPPTADAIPDLLIQQLNYISNTLRTCFAEKPPHTIQRFAELVLSPTKDYKTLPAWLRAVDRVVSVSSTADIFPLPHAQPLPGSVVDSTLTNGVPNGVGSGTGGGGILWTNSDNRNGYETGLGSDESLGGALLTPIPWLKNGVNSSSSDISSPRLDPLGEPIDVVGNAMVPEREDGAVTQGELIRQEQEAGIVPVGQSMVSRGLVGGDDDDELDDADIVPHARGPDIVGAEDIGLQGGKNIELQISGHTDVRRDEAGLDESDDDASALGAENAASEIQPADDEDNDGDILLTDADGKTEDQAAEKADATGENIGPDAADTSAI